MTKTHNRRPRCDSAEVAVEAAAAAAQPMLEPPPFVRLSAEAREFWPGIIMSRARKEWRDVDLVVAAQLAEAQATIERETRTLRTEGMVMTNQRGTPIENPRNRVVQTLAVREMALMRTLQMGGSATGINKRNLYGARAAEQAARELREELGEEAEEGTPGPCGRKQDLLA